MACIQYDIGMTYYVLDDLQQSLKHFRHSSNDYKTLCKGDKGIKALLIGNMSSLKMVAMTHMNLDNHKPAEKYYKKALRRLIFWKTRIIELMLVTTWGVYTMRLDIVATQQKLSRNILTKPKLLLNQL